jgi:hypothetical protein
MLSRMSIANVPFVRRSARSQFPGSLRRACTPVQYVGGNGGGAIPEFGSSSFAAIASKLWDAMVVTCSPRLLVPLPVLFQTVSSSRLAILWW